MQILIHNFGIITRDFHVNLQNINFINFIIILRHKTLLQLQLAATANKKCFY